MYPASDAPTFAPLPSPVLDLLNTQSNRLYYYSKMKKAGGIFDVKSSSKLKISVRGIENEIDDVVATLGNYPRSTFL